MNYSSIPIVLSQNSFEMADSISITNQSLLKYSSLVCLMLQNALVGLSMRYAATRTLKNDRFLSSTAVLMSELIKLFTSLVFVFFEHEKNVLKFISSLHKTIIVNKLDTFKVCLPSLLYIVQNNLLYVSAANLNPVTNQVSYQLKILTTAVFAVIILRKTLLFTQWCSLLLLIGGVALVQINKDERNSAPFIGNNSSQNSSLANTLADKQSEQNQVLGFAAVMCACVLSGFAGVYFEKLLKGAEISLWMRNVQMSLLSIPFGLITYFFKDYNSLIEKGFFHGYDWYVVYLVSLNAYGGILVGFVVKYADSILRGFATTLGIIVTCIASIFIFDFQLTILFGVGALLVFAATFLYSYTPKPAADTNNNVEKDIEMDEQLMGDNNSNVK